MRHLHLILRRLIIGGGFLAILVVAYGWFRQRPQDLPWTSLDLAQPIGMFTGRKLVALARTPGECRMLLDRAGIPYADMKPGGADQCRHDDSVRLKSEPGAIILSPASVAPSCPVVAAFKLWEWQVVQPVAQRIYGQPVRLIRHFGSYGCRRMYGRDKGAFSEHATANAIDIAAFELRDGRRISVAGDWKGQGKDAMFLHQVRDGACDVFSTVLSPDYNAAHRDHFHLDQADRGTAGWRACR